MPTAHHVAHLVAAAVLSLLSARPAAAQLEIGTWVRKPLASAPGMATMLKIEACCGAGRRLSYITTAGTTKFTLTVESRLDGTEAPVVANGKATGETMAIKRVDAHHATNVVKLNGKPFATSTATLSADGKTLTVVTDNTSPVGGAVGKQTEIYIKQ